MEVRLLDISFLNLILTFPTVILTIVLGILLGFWLLVILGALDSDLLQVDLPDGIFHSIFAGLLASSLPMSTLLTLIFSLTWAGSVPITYYSLLFFSDTSLQLIIATILTLVSFFIITYSIGFLLSRVVNKWQGQTLQGQEGLIGKICVISTQYVDENFGQGHYEKNGTDLILSLHAQTPNTLTKGTKALIVDYDAQQNVYTVTSYDDIVT